MTASRVQIGVVSKAHGIRGELVVILHDPESTALDEVETVHVGGVARAVVQARNTGGAYLLAVEGITDRDAAGALRGAVVEVENSGASDEDEPGVRGVVVGEATLPEEPSSPDVPIDLLAGLLLGAFVGVGAVTARHLLRDPESA